MVIESDLHDYNDQWYDRLDNHSIPIIEKKICEWKWITDERKLDFGMSEIYIAHLIKLSPFYCKSFNPSENQKKFFQIACHLLVSHYLSS